MKDLTGQRFGKLIVLEYTGKNQPGRGCIWKCKCDCGNYKEVASAFLTQGAVKSCGCLAYPNLKGQKFNRLTVISERNYKKGGKTGWLCKCDCGNEIIVTTNDLKYGHTKSCGCYNLDRIAEQGKSNASNLIGHTFGRLTVLEKTNERQNNNIKWLCECSCENHTRVLVSTNDLTSGNTISCGCIRISKGEYSIQQSLLKAQINFKTQYVFDDLIGNRNKLRFDFAIFDKQNCLKCLIEYNGKQHYEPINYFGGKEKYEQQVKYDLQKQQYCQDHDIPLIIISYKEYALINQEYITNLINKYM